MQEESIADRAGATQWGPLVVRWAVRCLPRKSEAVLLMMGVAILPDSEV